MLKNFFKAGIGGAGSQAINFLALPIISRLYEPRDYAVWALIIAGSSILSSIACLRYELAIVIPQDDEEASSVFWLCIILVIFFTILTFFLTWIPLVQRILFNTNTGNIGFFWVLPILVFLIGFNAAIQYWAVRKEAFLLNSIGFIGRAGGTVLTQIVLAIAFSAKGIFLVLGTLVGELTFFLIVIGGLTYVRKGPLMVSSFSSLTKIAKTYRLFPYYSTPYTIFGTLRSRAAVYILENFLGPKIVGLYAFAQRILNFPVTLISGALRPVLFQKTASEGIKAMENRLNLLLRNLALLSLPFFVFYLYYPEEIFSIVFGSKWTEAGRIGVYLIWPAYTFLFCNWMDRIMDVLKQQRLSLILEVVFSIVSLVILAVLLQLGYSWRVAVIMQCIVLTLYNFTYIYATYKNAGYSFLPLYRILLLLSVIGGGEWILLKSLDLMLNIYLSIAIYTIINLILWLITFRSYIKRFIGVYRYA